ncbi:MAG: hypothetical protein GXP40_02000 [Chloroflexi bacterium]|nr:hypothetical protein [Chloroflexota bacterium]
MQLDTGQWVVIGVSIVLLGWYIGGYYYNRRQAEKIFAWLREGLTPWGELRAGKRLSGMTTGGRVRVQNAAAPFRRIEATFTLEARENLFFWLFNLLQGKRDELVLEVALRQMRVQEIVAARDGDAELKRVLAAPGKKPFQFGPGPRDFQIARRGAENDDGVQERVKAFLEVYGKAVYRLSLQRNEPQLKVYAKLPFLLPRSARAFFEDLQQLVG